MRASLKSIAKIAEQTVHPSWMKFVKGEFQQEYFAELEKFIRLEYSRKQAVYPASEDIFRALQVTPFSKVKIVILGQDPYHGEQQAHGLSFSVNRGVKVPPSLVNIYKERFNDLSIPPSEHGDLSSWAKQGVLLLNAVLTVRAGAAASHQKKGWESFTDHVIEHLSQSKEHLVFILWGAAAIKKGKKIDRKRHKVLESVHPSPLSSYRGFFGSKPFSKSNRYLKSHKIKTIDWSLPK